jgi:hypothetical protein
MINEIVCLKSARKGQRGQIIMEPLKIKHEVLLKSKGQFDILRTKAKVKNIIRKIT